MGTEASGYDAPMTTMTKTTQNRREGNNCFPLSIYTAHRAVLSVIPRRLSMTSALPIPYLCSTQ